MLGTQGATTPTQDFSLRCNAAGKEAGRQGRAGQVVSCVHSSLRLLTICDGKPSILFFDLEVVADIVGGATHIVLVVVLAVRLGLLIVVGRWSGSRVDILWLPWGLRHLLIESGVVSCH